MNHDASSNPEAEAQARDRLVDGLLRTQHELPIDRERRVAVAMRAVRRDVASAHPLRRIVRAAGGLAAVAAVMVAAVVFTPREVAAADRARATLQRERSGSDRRVMFILSPPSAHPERPALTGTLDLRDARHMVLTIRTPDGREQIHGVNGDEAWEIEADGSMHAEPSDHPWPVWIQSPRGGLLVDMAETIESGLAPGWAWSLSKSSSDEAGVEQLVATREKGPRAEPNRIVASIDAMSGRVKRLEIKWPEGGAPAPFEGRPAPGADRPPPPGAMQGHRPPMDATRGEERGPSGPPPFGPGMHRGQRPGDPGQGPPPGARGPGGGAPMGAPGDMVIIPEPAITFPDDWFDAARHTGKP